MSGTDAVVKDSCRLCDSRHLNFLFALPKHQAFREGGGKFIVPIPRLEVV